MDRINSLGDSTLHWAEFSRIHQLFEWLVSCGQDAMVLQLPEHFCQLRLFKKKLSIGFPLHYNTAI